MYLLPVTSAPLRIYGLANSTGGNTVIQTSVPARVIERYPYLTSSIEAAAGRVALYTRVIEFPPSVKVIVLEELSYVPT